MHERGGRLAGDPNAGLIDATALEALTALEHDLDQRGIQPCLAEVKGPVMDRLERTELGARLKGRVYLSTRQAFSS